MRELRTYASIQLIGEYGVYANGKMVQLMLPLHSTMKVVPSSTPSREDPEQSSHTIDVIAELSKGVYSDAQQQELKRRAVKRVGKIVQWLREHRIAPRGGSIEFHSDFPLGLGIEDNLSLLTHWCLGSECSFQEIAERIIECEWRSRPTCSYMYLLPAIKLAATQVTTSNNLFLFERDMPSFESWAEFGEAKNCPVKIRPAWQWIEKAIPVRLDGIRSNKDKSVSAVFDIALFARPKATLLERLHPSVREAVASLTLPRSWRFLRNLGNLTDQAFLILLELADLLRKARFEKDEKENLLNLWWELGRVLTCYHFTMSAMQRTDPLSDKFVLEVTQQMNVVGAKTTGPGLGGTVFVLYFAEEGQEEVVREEIQSLADKYGYTNLCGSILRSFHAI